MALADTCALIFTNITQDCEVICILAKDVQRFLSLFYGAISRSTPHLYISALCWVPEESYMHRVLCPFFSNESLIISGRSKKWPAALWMNGTSSWAWQVAFSLDGRYIAAGSRDRCIYI